MNILLGSVALLLLYLLCERKVMLIHMEDLESEIVIAREEVEEEGGLGR